MAILFVIGEGLYYSGIRPARITIRTDDDLATVMTEGYLDGETTLTYSDELLAMVETTEGLVELAVSMANSHVSLIYPLEKPTIIESLSTSPDNSQSSSLAIGTAYQNTFGYDILLTAYVNITLAVAGNLLLGVGDTNNPTQQTILSSLTVAALEIVSIPIYIPNGYWAKLSTSGTITASLSGQMAMPI